MMADLWIIATQWSSWLSWVFLAAGSFFVFTGAIGILRFPDIYTRLHAVSLTDTLGLELLVIGLMIESGWSMASLKLFLIGLFILFTSPTAAHALANAAFVSNIQPKQNND